MFRTASGRAFTISVTSPILLKKLAEKYYEIPRLDDIRDDYEFDVSCMGTMPVALSAFFESTGFEDAIRNAISVGGDSDTIAAITGSIAEPYYGIPEHIWETACTYLKCSDLVIPLHNRPQMTSERASAARRAANEQRRQRQAALLAGIIQ